MRNRQVPGKTRIRRLEIGEQRRHIGRRQIHRIDSVSTHVALITVPLAVEKVVTPLSFALNVALPARNASNFAENGLTSLEDSYDATDKVRWS
jgi:hypothetical protein